MNTAQRLSLETGTGHDVLNIAALAGRLLWYEGVTPEMWRSHDLIAVAVDSVFGESEESAVTEPSAGSGQQCCQSERRSIDFEVSADARVGTTNVETVQDTHISLAILILLRRWLPSTTYYFSSRKTREGKETRGVPSHSPRRRACKREILMAYPAATVRIEKTDESGREK